MQAGDLRHLVALEQLIVTQDTTTGATQESWVPFARVWAHVNPMSGREFVAAQAVQAGVNTRITIRHIDGVRPTMRVNYLGTYYNILAVLPDPTLVRHINLMCSSGPHDG